MQRDRRERVATELIRNLEQAALRGAGRARSRSRRPRRRVKPAETDPIEDVLSPTQKYHHAPRAMTENRFPLAELRVPVVDSQGVPRDPITGKYVGEPFDIHLAAAFDEEDLAAQENEEPNAVRRRVDDAMSTEERKPTETPEMMAMRNMMKQVV